jgi:hypothetical protein
VAVAHLGHRIAGISRVCSGLGYRESAAARGSAESSEGDGDQDTIAGHRVRPAAGQTQALVIVTVEFDGPSEAMTFTVLVPNDSDEGAVREQAIARAQELARRFAELRRSLPPPPAPPIMPSG